MAGTRKFSIPSFDEVAGNSSVWSYGKHMESIVKLLRVNSALVPTPSSFSVGRYGFQITFCFLGKGKCSH